MRGGNSVLGDQHRIFPTRGNVTECMDAVRRPKHRMQQHAHGVGNDSREGGPRAGNRFLRCHRRVDGGTAYVAVLCERFATDSLTSYPEPFHAWFPASGAGALAKRVGQPSRSMVRKKTFRYMSAAVGRHQMMASGRWLSCNGVLPHAGTRLTY